MRLPPYGKMSEEYVRLVRDTPMDDWLPDLSMPEREARFIEWREKMRNTIADHIWPWYDRATNTWVGNAANWAEKATEAEIAIMIEQLQMPPSKIGQLASSANMVEPADPHYQHYRDEDNPDFKAFPTAINLKKYDRTLTEVESAEAIALVDAAYAKKIDGLFWLKHQFVRPRPYQTSMLFHRHDFQSRTSRLALHSACNSGHCIEGILFSCALADAWLSAATQPDGSRLASLKQYAVDFGDRRVFAGVHYPSDNIASWVVALELIPYVFAESQRILDFAVDAIANYSSIYRVIQDAFPKVPELEGALSLLSARVKPPSV